jgi:hypothetical protein
MIACEWGCAPENDAAVEPASLRATGCTACSVHNKHACKRQPGPSSLVGSRDPWFAPVTGSKPLAGRLQLPVIPVTLRHKLLLTE